LKDEDVENWKWIGPNRTIRNESNDQVPDKGACKFQPFIELLKDYDLKHDHEESEKDFRNG
jgi:hypothetical protein